MSHRFNRHFIYMVIFFLSLFILPLLASIRPIYAVASNLILNPSVETVSDSNSQTPNLWENNSWGSNTSEFSYEAAGYDGSKSVRVDVTNYVDGDAKWYFYPISVSANTQYTFSDYYKSNVNTEIMAQYQSTSGVYTYQWLKNVPASTVWKNVSVNFTTPANVKSLTIFHLIHSNGYLVTDNYSLTEVSGTPAPTPLNITVTSPTNNSVVSGIVQLGVSVQGSNVTGVQYKLNNVNIGNVITTSPYTLNWNSTSKADGAYNLTAVVSDSNGDSKTSVPITINIQNTTPVPIPNSGNVVPNYSVENVRANNKSLPVSWTKHKFGVNNTQFTYLNTGHTGSKSLQIKMTSYTSGDSHYEFAPQAVEAGKSYRFNAYYKSDVYSEANVAVYLNDGSVEYIYLGSIVPSTSWNLFEVDFKMPSNAQKATVYLALSTVGYLITDDYSLKKVPSPTPLTHPIVTLTFDDMYPTFYSYAYPLFQQYNASATLYLTSQDFDQPGMMTKQQLYNLKNYGFEIGSHSVTHPHLTQITPQQAEAELKNSRDTISQYFGGIAVNSFASPYGEYNQEVLNLVDKYYDSHRSTDVGFNNKDNVNRLNVRAQSVTSQTPISTVLGWIDQAIEDSTWLVIVYHDVKPDDGSGFLWTTTPEDLEAVLKKLADNNVDVMTTTQALASVGISPSPAPVPDPLSISITSPTNNSTVANSITISSNVSGSNIKDVQYKLNGNNIGGKLTSAPYSLTWDTKTYANGSYTLTSVVTDTIGNSKTSNVVNITINNTIPTTPPDTGNVVPNPSVETLNSSNPNLPFNWVTEKGGTNNASFSYINGGHTGTKALKVEATSFTSGSANFHFNPVNVSAGMEYEFKLFYKSSDYTELDAYVQYSDGSDGYLYLATIPSSSVWTNYTTYFTIPSNVTAITIYLSLTSVGYLITDDYSLTMMPVPEPFERAIVSLTFDDGLLSHYTQAKSILESNGMKGTFYIDTGQTGTSGRMSVAQYQSLASNGHEVSSHTVSHAHLTSLSPSQLDNELKQSKNTLIANGVGNLDNLASPYGEYNDEVIENIKKYYSSHRSTDVGYNYKNRFNPYNILVQNVNKDTTVAQVKAWVDKAIAEKSWLVLVYHDLTTNGDAFSTVPANLASELSYIKSTGVTVKTVDAALSELLAQI